MASQTRVTRRRLVVRAETVGVLMTLSHGHPGVRASGVGYTGVGCTGQTCTGTGCTGQFCSGGCNTRARNCSGAYCR